MNINLTRHIYFEFGLLSWLLVLFFYMVLYGTEFIMNRYLGGFYEPELLIISEINKIKESVKPIKKIDQKLDIIIKKL